MTSGYLTRYLVCSWWAVQVTILARLSRRIYSPDPVLRGIPTRYMALSTGIDPVLRVPQTRVLPLHQDGRILERSRRIELLASDWKSEVLPLYELRKEFLERWKGVEPSTFTLAT